MFKLLLIIFYISLSPAVGTLPTALTSIYALKRTLQAQLRAVIIDHVSINIIFITYPLVPFFMDLLVQNNLQSNLFAKIFFIHSFLFEHETFF